MISTETRRAKDVTYPRERILGNHPVVFFGKAGLWRVVMPWSSIAVQVSCRDSINDGLVEVVDRHTGINDHTLRRDPAAHGTQQENGCVSNLVSSYGLATWDDLFCEKV